MEFWSAGLSVSSKRAMEKKRQRDEVDELSAEERVALRFHLRNLKLAGTRTSTVHGAPNASYLRKSS